MVTYADTVTLLMTFFVLLMTFQSVDHKKFSAVASVFREMLGVHPDGNIGLKLVAPTPLRIGQTSQRGTTRPPIYGELETLEREMKLTAESVDEDRLVDFRLVDRGLLLRLQPEMFFDAGKAKLKTDDIGILQALAGVLRTTPYHLRVLGHGDEFFVPSARFPRNRLLAMARAASVCDFLTGPCRVQAARVQAAAQAGELDSQGAVIEILVMRPRGKRLRI